MSRAIRAGWSSGPLAAAAVVVILVVVTLSSSLFGGKIFSSGDNILLWPPFKAEAPQHWRRPSNSILSDPAVNFDPHRIDTRRDLRSGTLPLWNPYSGAGRPLFGAAQDAPLFPPTWLAFVLPYWSSLAWIAAIKLVLAAMGTYLLARALELRRGPSLLAAVAFAFGLYFFDWLEHPHTNVWSMLPWMFLAARRVSTRGSLGGAALLVAASGLSWLGDHPETAAFLLASTAVYGLLELTAERFGSPAYVSELRLGPSWTAGIWSRAGLLLGSLFLGFGVGAVANIPLIELIHQSAPTNRGIPPFSFRAGWSFFFPERWGTPSKAFSTKGPGLNFNERTAYIGALPLLLAIGALARRRPREQWFFVGIAVFSLLIVYDTPVARAIAALPDGRKAAVDRLLVIVSLCGALLAAYGLQHWITGTAKDRRQMLWLMGFTVALPPVLWVGAHSGTLPHLGAALVQLPAVHSSERSWPVIALGSVWRWIVVGGVGIGALVIAGQKRMVVGLVILLVGADLVTLDRGYHGSIPLSQANPPVPASTRYLQANVGHSRIVASAITQPPNISERYGLRDPRAGNDALFPRRWLSLWAAMGGSAQGGEKLFEANQVDAQRLANLFAVRYVMLPPTERVPGWLVPVLHTSGATVALNRTALPRAWVAYGWRQAPDQADALAATASSSATEVRDAPVIEGAPAGTHNPGHVATPAQFIVDGVNNVILRADALRPGYLILDDTAYPGWQASVDGRAEPWYPANENFRAVAIASGRHIVTFRYRPASVVVGAIAAVVSAAALLVLGFFAIAYRRCAK